MCVIFHLVDEDFNIETILARLEKYAKCKEGEQIAQAIAGVLGAYSVDKGHKDRVSELASQVLSFQRDRAASNTLAQTYLLDTFYDALDLHCLSHTLTHVGEHCSLPYLKKFHENLLAMMNYGGGTNKATYHWRRVMGSEFHHPGLFCTDLFYF